MPSERIQRQLDRLLGEADVALREHNWTVVRERARTALTLDPDNRDAAGYITVADRARAPGSGVQGAGHRGDEAELQAELDSLKWLVDSSAVGVFVVEASTRKVLMANREVQRVLGFPHSPEHDWQWYEHAYERRRPNGQLYAPEELPLTRALEHGETVRAEEMWLEFRDGRKVRILASAMPVYSKDGRLIAVVVLSQDITPLDVAIPPHDQGATDRASEHKVHLRLLGGRDITLEFASGTEQGPERQNNEDSIYCEPQDSTRLQDKGWACAVADGMGGHAMGEVASQMAIKAFVEAYYSSYYTGGEGVKQAALRANSAVYEAAQNNPAYRGMGTTLTAAVFIKDMVAIAHVGDSRAYLVRQGVLQQLTNDHTFAAELVRLKAITLEQAAVNPYRNVLTRSVGASPKVEIDLVQHQTLDGDIVMLCSDGISKRLTEQLIAQALTSQSPQAAVESLINMSKQRGGDDDMSVIIVSCSGGRDSRDL